MTTYSEDMLIGELKRFSETTPGVMQSLQRTQELLGYVPDTALDVVAEVCNVSRAEVYGVLTFYADFRRTAPAEVIVKVCVAESCQAVGGRELIQDLHHEGFDVHAGTVRDGIACEQTFCLGNCALSPAAMINGKPLGRATAASILAAAKAAK